MWECHIEYLLYRTQMILVENKNLKWYVPSSKIKKKKKSRGKGMDRENYIMGQNYTSVVTSPFLCCTDRGSNYCIYVFFNDMKLVSKAKWSI